MHRLVSVAGEGALCPGRRWASTGGVAGRRPAGGGKSRRPTPCAAGRGAPSSREKGRRFAAPMSPSRRRRQARAAPRNAAISAERAPCRQPARRLRARPSAVRGPVLAPPCIRQRPLRMAGPRQAPPARVCAPQRGAARKSPDGLPLLSRPRRSGGNERAPSGSAGPVSWRRAITAGSLVMGGIADSGVFMECSSRNIGLRQGRRQAVARQVPSKVGAGDLSPNSHPGEGLGLRSASSARIAPTPRRKGGFTTPTDAPTTASTPSSLQRTLVTASPGTIPPRSGFFEVPRCRFRKSRAATA